MLSLLLLWSLGRELFAHFEFRFLQLHVAYCLRTSLHADINKRQRSVEWINGNTMTDFLKRKNHNHKAEEILVKYLAGCALPKTQYSLIHLLVHLSKRTDFGL
jgi:hypothetical protein